MLGRWISHWSVLADEAALGLGTILEDVQDGGVSAAECAGRFAGLDGIDDFRVDWQWRPAWRPADITESGREQLRAIGFTL
ncbi:hypothetical protein [Kribbella sp. VKM Ac-2568]|uniref:hypothetical protein n=1 Tax=Kribbella sp. VKM Ac-2568 TaxID=2512219 RepID=UPI0018EEB2CD|nr:hypothetical protein [Kribbella sp. VKM Ac-2568]